MADLFVLHADAADDTAFVRGSLLPALGLADDRVLLSSRLPLGVSVVQALQDGVIDARVTVAIVSPAFLRESWSVFGEQLATHHAIHGGLLVPLWFRDCALPLRLDSRVKLDCRDEAQRPTAYARLRELLAAPEPPAREIPCPYPGMRPYTADNAALFYGREREVDDLVARFDAGMRELYVIGPSGSGKSSLLLAGVLPRLALARGSSAGTPLVARSFRPGVERSKRLDAAVAALAGLHDDLPHSSPPIDGDGGARAAPRGLVVVDQLEEVFTQADAADRAAFFAALHRLRQARTCRLAFTVRADFLGALMQSDLWPHVTRAHRHEVAPLRDDALRRAITAPAARFDVSLEPALIDDIVEDAAGEPGSLPLIQEALVHLWAHREGNLLTARAYAELGAGAANGNGLAVALSRRADVALADLVDDDQRIARRVFLRLVNFGEGRADTRRQQALTALRGDEPEARLRSVVDHLAAARLLTTTGDDATGTVLVDLAHETLISSWSKLRAWIGQHRKDEQQRRTLAIEAAAWTARVAAGHRHVDLLGPGRLAELDTWLAAPTTVELGLDSDVIAFLTTSRTALSRRRRRTMAITAAVISILVVAVVVVAFLALRAREETRRAERQLALTYVAQAENLIDSGRGARAIPYLVAARERGIDDVRARTLFQRAERAVPLATLLYPGAHGHVAWSPDGARVATLSYDTGVRIWNAASGEALTEVLPADSNAAFAWSPDGRRLAVTIGDAVAIWDPSARVERLATLVHSHPVRALAWSPDGTVLATGDESGQLRAWNTAKWNMAEEAQALQEPVLHLAWDRGGTRIAASTPRDAWLWSPRGGERVRVPLTAVPATVPVRGTYFMSLAWSPSDARLATAEGETVEIWAVDAPGAQPVSIRSIVHAADVVAVAWSPDGAWLATGCADGSAGVWNASTGERVSEYSQGAPVEHVAWSGDSVLLASGGRGAAIHVWDARSGTTVVALEARSADEIRWSSTGDRFATASPEVRIWARPAVPPATIERRTDIGDALLNPAQPLLASCLASGQVTIWDTRTWIERTTPMASTGNACRLLWNPAGTALAALGDNGGPQIWEVGAATTRRLPRSHRAYFMSWSPDGSRIAAIDESQVEVWDAHTGQQISLTPWDEESVMAKYLRMSFDVVADGPNSKKVWNPSSTELWDGRRERGWCRDVGPYQCAISRSHAMVAVVDGSSVQIRDRHERLLGSPFVHPGRENVHWLMWSPDDARVLSNVGSSVRIWDTLGDHTGYVSFELDASTNRVQWSYDDRWIVFATNPGVLVLDVTWSRGSLEAWYGVLNRGSYRLRPDGQLESSQPW